MPVAPSNPGAAMPALNDLQGSLAINLVLSLTISGHGPRGQPESSLHINVARLTDHAIREYELARIALEEYRSVKTFSELVAGVANLESTIVSLHRALEFLARLRKLGLQHSDGSPLVPRPRDLVILSEAIRNRIRNIRHAIQHLDEKVIHASAGNTMPIMLLVEADHIAIEQEILSYGDLAEWLRALHGIVDEINQARPSARPLPSAP